MCTRYKGLSSFLWRNFATFKMTCKLTTNMVPNVGHALLPNTDLRRLSAKMKTFGTQMAKASMAMMRSLSNLVWKQQETCLIDRPLTFMWQLLLLYLLKSQNEFYETKLLYLYYCFFCKSWVTTDDTFFMSPAPVVIISKLTFEANAQLRTIAKKSKYMTHLTMRTGPSKHCAATIPESRDTVMNTSHPSVFICL